MISYTICIIKISLIIKLKENGVKNRDLIKCHLDLMNKCHLYVEDVLITGGGYNKKSPLISGGFLYNYFINYLLSETEAFL